MLNVGRKDRAKDLVTQDQIPFAFPTDTTKTYTFTPGTGWVVAAGGGSVPPYMLILDQRAAGNVQTLPSTTFAKRTLNTVVVNQISGASLSSDVITLPAGTYLIEACVPIYGRISAQSRIYNSSAGSTAVVGSLVYTQAETLMQSFILGLMTITTVSNIQVDGVVGTQANGASAGFTTDVVYTQIKITKTA